MMCTLLGRSRMLIEFAYPGTYPQYRKDCEELEERLRRENESDEARLLL